MRSIPFSLLVALMMMPQISETLYSPALTAISETYSVSASMSAQTLSSYFFAFALGVVCWGILCDRLGRRKTILIGLATYCVGAIGALIAMDFSFLIATRLFSAFGAAVGSVGTQTLLRDLYAGPRLDKAFAIMGIGLSISPIIGMVSGGFLTSYGGATGVFCGQIGMALFLFFWSYGYLCETRWTKIENLSIRSTFIKMLTDFEIWHIALLIALFNVMLYSLYAIAPFLYAANGLSSSIYGLSGIVLAVGGLIGAWLNHFTVQRKISFRHQIMGALYITAFSGFLFLLFKSSLWILLPSLLIPIAYGLAIPALLSKALYRYKETYGIAGALLGLIYYSLIALGLSIAAIGHNIAMVILICATMGFIGIASNKKPVDSCS